MEGGGWRTEKKEGKLEGERRIEGRNDFYQMKSALFFYPNLRYALLGKKETEEAVIKCVIITTGLPPAE